MQHDGLVHPMMMQDGTTATHQHVDFFPLPYYSQPPFDLPGFGFGYTWPIDPYQAVGNGYISPEDEYRPTDGPLWNPTERPSMLSALATPWYPSSYGSDSYAATESLGTSQIPERPPSPAPPHAEPSTQPQPSSSTYAAEQEGQSTSDAPQPDLSTLFNQPFDASLSERLRQLEALSASLLALTGGSSSAPGTSAYAEQHPPLPMSPPLLPHPRHRPEAPPTRNLPERPVGAPVESSKRLMGVLEDKGNNGYFDLSAPNLDPPAPSAPIPPVVDFTLVMAQLPKKFRKVEFVTSWAKRYGTPVRVVVDAKSGKALVEWVGSHSADGAFASLRLRGDGKEHIRVYRYKGDKPPRTLRPFETSFPADKEIEEGEIEEGEVVETNLKFKKKKNKGKKKAPHPHLEERLADPVPLVAHPRVPDVNVVASSAPVPEHSTSRPDAAPVALTIPSPRQPLIERFSEMPLLPTSREDAWEEEMELESEDEARKSQPSPPLVMSASTVGEPEEEDMDLEDDVDDVGAEDADAEDEDMEMSSVADGSRPPSPALEITTASPAPQPPVVTAALDESFIQELAPPVPEVPPLTTEKKEASIKEIRRQKLEDAIARTKAELAMRALAYSSRTSLSSNGSSESPEPMTPLDSPSLDHARVVTDAKESAVDGSVVIKTESTTVNFDDLASSFISETIHAAAVLPHSSPFPTSTPTVSLEQPRNTPSSTVAAPIPISIQTSAPFAPTTVTVPLTEEQKQIKQKRWLELVSTSKSLFGKIAAAKTKEEKDLLMRLLKAKTK